MIKFLKYYYPEFLIIVGFFAIILIDVSPNLTFLMVSADGTAYVMSAKYFYPAHHTSAPLYLLLGHLFLWLPIGTEYWRMALMSAVCALGGMIFVYFITRQLLIENKKSRLFAILAVLVFGSSMLLISQSIIVETYTMVTMFSLGAFYFALRKNWVLASVMLGGGLVTHHLILITWIVLIIFYKNMRRWKPMLITLSFLLFYLYMPLSKMFTDQPNMWLNSSISEFFRDNFYTMITLIGQISIWDLPKRIIDTIGIVGVSLGIGLIPLTWYCWKQKFWKNPLLWLFTLPILYFSVDLDPHTSKYCLVGIAFGSVIIALAVSKLNMKWLVAVGLCSLIMLGVNINFFDLGRNLDPNLTATEFYNKEYPKVPDNGILMSMLSGGEWQMTFYYNKNEGKHIIPICVGMLTNPAYQKQLETQGVKLTSNDIENMTDSEIMIALSIIRENDSVWLAKSTTPQDYGSEIVPAIGNEAELTKWLGYKVEPTWQFKLSNPYDIVSGSIEQEWNFIIRSNKTAMWLFVLAIGGFMVVWYIIKIFENRKRKKEKGLNNEVAISKKEKDIKTRRDSAEA
jgi:hypothetical protein